MPKRRTIARTVIQIQYGENCPNGLNTFSVIWQDDDRGDCDSPIWNSSPCLTASYHGYHGAVQPSPRSHRSTSQANPAVYMQCWWGLNRDQLLVPSCLSGIASSNIFRGGCVVPNGSNSCQSQAEVIYDDMRFKKLQCWQCRATNLQKLSSLEPNSYAFLYFLWNFFRCHWN